MIQFILMILVLVSCGRDPSSSDLSHREIPARDPSIAMIGDSIATGVFASTKLGDWPNKLDKYLLEFIVGINPQWNSGKFILHINQAAEKATEREEVEHRAISTKAEWGLRQEIANIHEIEVADVRYFLQAGFGAGVSRISNFVDGLKEDYSRISADFRPGYVVVMLGANNFCSRRRTNSFSKSLQANLKVLAEVHPSSRIVVAQIPPIMAIKELDHKYKVVVKAKVLGNDVNVTLADAFTAREMRENYCTSLYLNDAEKRLTEINTIIDEEVKAIRDELKLDIRLAPGITTMPIERKHLAFDGFHPSVEGQKLIAEHLRPALR